MEVAALIDAGADVNHVYAAGLTPLHFAAVHNKPEVARELRRCGADPDAETSDEYALTAAKIAAMSDHYEVVDAILEAAGNPLRLQLTGPCCIAAVLLVNVGLGLLFTSDSTVWDGYQDAEDAMLGGIPFQRSYFVTGAALCLACLVMVNNIDPGAVNHEDVAYADKLYALPEDEKITINEEKFGVMHPDGTVEAFRWCSACKLWKPNGVSHCSDGRRCFWRFDHHCNAVGTTIAARNHCMFALMLLSGSTSWLMGDLSVFLRLWRHGAFSLQVWWPLRTQQWPLYIALPFLAIGFMCGLALFAFAIFHTLALFFNFNTKMCFTKQPRDDTRYRLNDYDVFEQLFLQPFQCREPSLMDLMSGKRARSVGLCRAGLECDKQEEKVEM